MPQRYIQEATYQVSSFYTVKIDILSRESDPYRKWRGCNHFRKGFQKKIFEWVMPLWKAQKGIKVGLF